MPTKNSKGYIFLDVRSKFSPRFAAILAGVLVVAGAVVVAASHASARATDPCSSIGGGKYNCNFYTQALVYDGNGTEVGVIAIYNPVNYVYCQEQAGTSTDPTGQYHNNWWAWTDTDPYTEASGNRVPSTSGWVNAVYASGGDDYGQFNGVPYCGGSHGQAPGGNITPTSSQQTTTTNTSTYSEPVQTSEQGGATTTKSKTTVTQTVGTAPSSKNPVAVGSFGTASESAEPAPTKSKSKSTSEAAPTISSKALSAAAAWCAQLGWTFNVDNGSCIEPIESAVPAPGSIFSDL